MDVWLGTSGFSYPDWVGGFYPPGTRPAGMLAAYARHFPTVELNYTFYRPPTPEGLVRLAASAPPGFQFLVKVPRTISHEGSPVDLAGFHAAASALAERQVLAGVLCQFPQAFHHGRLGFAWLDTVAAGLVGLRPAFEFRHRSWARLDVGPWLAQRGVALVAVDAPPLASLYPSGMARNGPRIYVRFHSRNAENWYGSDKERYDYDYADAALVEWADALTRHAEAGEAWLLFNNCMRSQAADNARRMGELLRELYPELRVVPPFAAETPRQRSLFGEES